MAESSNENPAEEYLPLVMAAGALARQAAANERVLDLSIQAMTLIKDTPGCVEWMVLQLSREEPPQQYQNPFMQPTPRGNVR